MPAITYDGVDGVLTHVGSHVGPWNTARALARVTVPNNLLGIIQTLEASNASNRMDVIQLATVAARKYQRAVLEYMRDLAAAIDLRYMDRTTILDPMGIHGTPNIQDVIAAFIDKMDEDGASVVASTVTVGSPSADADNVGNGVVLADKKLDGVTRPSHDMPANRWYLNVDSELAIEETMTVKCVKDAQGTLANASYGVASAINEEFVEGEEQFVIYGYQPSRLSLEGIGVSTPGPFGFDVIEGSGTGPTFKTLNSHNIIFNRNFEHFSTANEADNFTENSLGTAGTHVLQDTSNKYRGSSSLKFVADAALATIQRDQVVPSRMLVGRKRYYFSIWLMATGAHSASKTVNILFIGTGYTAASSEKISIASSTLTGSWVRYGFYWTTPATIPTDLTLRLQWTSTPGPNGVTVHFDDIAFGPVTYHGGVNCVVIAGSTPWKVGDKSTFTVDNDGAGKIQEYHRRRYRMQLLSSGVPTISDSLVTTVAPTDAMPTDPLP